MTQGHFRDELVLQIIQMLGSRSLHTDAIPDAPLPCIFISHDSTPQRERAMCAWCQTGKTSRQCSDYEFHPPLCQTVERDCHVAWHQPSGSERRRQWRKRTRRSSSDANCMVDGLMA